MKIIPAIDLLGGKCVRLLRGNYNDVEVFNDDPLRMAMELESAGFKYLHLVDLDGARNTGTNNQVLAEIAKHTSLLIDFGGGLRSLESIRKAFDAGANQVNIGSMAVINPRKFEVCLKEHGEQIVWNADLKNGKIAINGWQQTVEHDLSELTRRFLSSGLKTILTTDVSKDGALQGPNFSLYRELIGEFPQINWIASGGVTSIKDVTQLKADGLAAVVVGKAIYKGLLRYEELIAIQDAD